MQPASASKERPDVSYPDPRNDRRRPCHVEATSQSRQRPVRPGAEHRARGRIAEADLAAVRLAGYFDAQPLGIVQHVALNTWTFCVDEIFGIEVDFPVVEARKAA